MALPSVRYNFEGGKKEIAEMVTGIGKAIFTQARGSFEAAAKTVVPNVKEMVAEITEDLSAGPIDRFKNGIQNLDKLINEFGVDLGKYSKDLADFLKLREEKSVQSEKTVNELRTQNIIAQVNEFGEVSILTRTQIEEQKNALIEQNKEIKENQKVIEQYSKIQQKGGELTEEQNEKLITANKKVIEKTEERSKTLETLNIREGEDTKSFREKFDDTIDTYVPDGLRDIGAAFTEGLTAPFTAIKELGVGFMGMLKPLKLLPKMLMMFSAGVVSAVISLAPFIGIALVVVAAIAGVIFILNKLGFGIDDAFKALSGFANFIMEIPGKIADFFTGIFAKIKNFFIDAINGVIDLINKFKPGKDIERIAKDPIPGEVDNTSSGDQDAAFTAGNLDQRTNDIEASESGLIPPVEGTGSSFLDRLKGMFATSSGNNEYMPVSAEAPVSGGTIIDNSVKTVNQNNQNQNLGISTRNDDATIFRTSDVAI